MAIASFTGATTALDATGAFGVKLGNAGQVLLIREFRLMHTAGSATTSTPSLRQTSTAALQSVDRAYLAPAAVAVATLISASPNVYVKLDADGKVYIVPTPDSGADNEYNYTLIVELP